MIPSTYMHVMLVSACTICSKASILTLHRLLYAEISVASSSPVAQCSRKRDLSVFQFKKLACFTSVFLTKPDSVRCQQKGKRLIFKYSAGEFLVWQFRRISASLNAKLVCEKRTIPIHEFPVNHDSLPRTPL